MTQPNSSGQTADVFAGVFSSQRLVFSHLLDHAREDFIPSRVEVICNENPTPRLKHWFSKANCAAVEDDLGLNTTCVIIFEHAKAGLETTGTDRLTYLGSFVALRHRP